MLLTELIESLKRKKAFSFAIIIIIFSFSMLMSLLFITYVYIQEKQESVQTFNEQTVYGLMDTLYEEEEQAFFNSTEGLTKIQNLYEFLDDELNETFISSTDQPIEVAFDNKNDTEIEIFLQGYEMGDIPNFREVNDKLYHSVKSVKVNQQVVETFPMDSLIEGRYFAEADFNEPDFESIPILLGSSYQGLFKLGDNISARYLDFPFNLEVIGFVEENAFVPTRYNYETYLDRYIILPVQKFDSPNNEEEFSFLMKHYLQIINGDIYSTENLEHIEGLVEQGKNRVNFDHFSVMGSSDSVFSEILGTIEKQLTSLTFLTLIIFITAILMISLLIWKKIKDNFKNISIHLVIGSTLNRVFSYIGAEILFLVCFPTALVALIIATTIGFHPALLIYGLIMLVSSLLIVLISCLIVYIALKNLSISNIIKRGE